MALIEYVFKIVVDFQSPLSEADLRTRLETSVVPDLDSKINQRLAPHIDGLTVERKTKLYSLVGPPVRFQFYPKAVIAGDTNKAQDFIEARIDDAHEDMKTAIDNDIAAQGGSVIGWHRHLIGGVVDEPG